MPEVDILRALCCLGVLLIHLSGFYWGQPVKDPSPGHLMAFVLVNEAVRYALFGFMFISGLLLTVRQGTFHLGTFMQKRVQLILIPYLAWGLIYFLVKVLNDPHPFWQVTQTLPFVQIGKALSGSVDHLKLVISWFLFGSWPHLYFINLMFQMYVFYAVLHKGIHWLLADKRRTLLLVLVVFALYPLWIYFRFVPYKHPELDLPGLLNWMAKHPNRLAFEWIPAFVFGLACGAYYQQFLAWVSRYRTVLCVVTLSALGITVTIAAAPWITAKLPSQLQNYGWPYSYLHPIFRLVYAFSINCLAMTAAVAALERLGGLTPPWLAFTSRFAAVSFGIYLFHPLLLEVLRKLPVPGIGKGFSYAVYNLSAYAYLIFVSLLVTAVSYLVVTGLHTWGKRNKTVGWMYGVLFGR